MFSEVLQHSQKNQQSWNTIVPAEYVNLQENVMFFLSRVQIYF